PGIAEANASSIPVILITSDIPLAGEGKQTITELDCQGLFQSITKWSPVLKSADKVPETVRRAFRIATSGRPGAVHLALPKETVVGQLSIDESALYADEECSAYPAYRSRGAREILEKVVDLMLRAHRPVIIAGGGANHSQAGRAIVGLAEWLSIPVVTTISGQGLIADDHPLALGVIGDNGFHPHAITAVEESDVLVYIGCKMGSVSTINWTLPSPKPKRKIIQIDINPNMLGNNFKNTVSLAGDARLVVEDLITMVRGRTNQRARTGWIDELNDRRRAFWEEAQSSFCSDQTPLKPQRIVASLNTRLPDQTIVIADAGTPTPYITRYLKLGGSHSRFLIPRAYGGLGYAIPAVVGAYMARPDVRLVGLFGDGSLGMSAGEMETLARLNVPAVLIHFNNSSFGWIKCLQKIHSREKYYSVDFTPGKPALVARGFGLKAIEVRTPGELDDGLDEAFGTDGPVFIDVVSEPEVDQVPPVYTWLNAGGLTEEKLRI
ncbi:MAG: thiamine pyrophosphate-binding protein, partial [Deltaproteobacteria bacterium]|nr:thiamine pyrophosphate-binding protein [Deltaproteobacteria bacterium]